MKEISVFYSVYESCSMAVQHSILLTLTDTMRLGHFRDKSWFSQDVTATARLLFVEVLS